jgi:hypothetical protein
MSPILTFISQKTLLLFSYKFLDEQLSNIKLFCHSVLTSMLNDLRVFGRRSKNLKNERKLNWNN